MSSSHAHLQGWSPPKNRDYLDVKPPYQALQNPTFHISEPCYPSSSFLRNDPENPGSPSSSTSSLSGEGGKRGDPSWVARPRNCFILFRCWYSQQHGSGGKRIRYPPGSRSNDKTLSKKAGEAWHKLPPEEQEYWRNLASDEKVEHARLHPEYIYRPRRNSTSGKRSGGAQITSKLSHLDTTSSSILADQEFPPETSGSANPAELKSKSSAVSLASKSTRRRSTSTKDPPPTLGPVKSEKERPISLPVPFPKTGTPSEGIPSTSMSLPLNEVPVFSMNCPATLPRANGFRSPPPMTRTTSSSLFNWNGQYCSQPISDTDSPSFGVDAPPISTSLADVFGAVSLTEHPQGENPWLPNTTFNYLSPTIQPEEFIMSPTETDAVNMMLVDSSEDPTLQ